MRDQLNRLISLKDIPQRIISLVPSQTELLCDLGLEQSIVGVTKFCVHPGDIKTTKIVVGGTKQIHLDKIKGLKPDIILCNKEENTEEIVKACELICLVHVSNIFTIQDSLYLIKQYGVIFDKTQVAKKIIDRIQSEFDNFKLFIQNHKKLKVVYFIWKNPWMVAGKNTFIDALLHINNFENIITKTRYPKIELSKVEQEVDIILLSSEPFPFKKDHKKELQGYFPNTTVIMVDGEMFSWYGSRLKYAFKYFIMLHSNLYNNSF